MGKLTGFTKRSQPVDSEPCIRVHYILNGQTSCRPRFLHKSLAIWANEFFILWAQSDNSLPFNSLLPCCLDLRGSVHISFLHSWDLKMNHPELRNAQYVGQMKPEKSPSGVFSRHPRLSDEYVYRKHYQLFATPEGDTGFVPDRKKTRVPPKELQTTVLSATRFFWGGE